MGPRLMSEETPASAPVHPDTISWMASVVYLVGTPTVFFFGYIVDNYGRKRALMLTSFAMAVSAFFGSASSSKFKIDYDGRRHGFVSYETYATQQ